MKPSIGRIVHFVETQLDPPRVSPAIITLVDPPVCSLIVFPEYHPGMPARHVLHESDVNDENNATYFWRWPPRVE